VEVKDWDWPLEDVVPLLRKVSFLERLPDGDLERIARVAQQAEAGEGEWLLREGAGDDAMFIVHSGSVDLVQARPSGVTERVATRGPGEAFGEVALLEEQAAGGGAQAREPTTLLRVGRKEFRSLLGEGGLALRVVDSLSRALRAAELRRAALERLNGRAPARGVDVKEISRLVQRGLLPLEAPRIQGFDIAAGTNLEDAGAGRTVWDHFQLRDGRIGLVVLAVTGDGLPPGHYLALVRGLLRELARDHDVLPDLLARVNSGLAAALVEGLEQFVEAGVLLPSSGGLEWAAMGRCPAAVLRRNGVLEELSSHGPPLGMLEGFRYGTQRIDLGAGDAVIVLSEASQGIFRGAADLVVSLQGKPVGEIVATVHRALRKAQPDGGGESSTLFARKQ
jgi:CRP-like cAMP-binding protein